MAFLDKLFFFKSCKNIFFVILLLFIQLQVCNAQISYLSYGFQTENDFKKEIKKAIAVEFGHNQQKIDSILDKEWPTFEAGFKMKLQQLTQKDSLLVFRDANKLISKVRQSTWKPRTGEITVDLKLLQIDSKGTDLLGERLRFETTNYADTSCCSKIEYSVTEGNKDSIILGYKCKNFRVTELLVDTSGDISKREITVWATQSINPAIPLYGVLWFRKKILAEWTPLYIHEEFLGPQYYTIITQAVGIGKNE